MRKKQALTIRLLRDAPRVYPGVVELVERASRHGSGWPIVSGTWRENVEAVLTDPGLAGSFELIIGKEDVGAVKPDPEAYLLALRRMGIRPARPWRSRTLPPDWRPPGPPAFLPSPSATAASSAPGSATGRTSPDSSRSPAS